MSDYDIDNHMLVDNYYDYMSEHCDDDEEEGDDEH